MNPLPLPAVGRGPVGYEPLHRHDRRPDRRLVHDIGRSGGRVTGDRPSGDTAITGGVTSMVEFSPGFHRRRQEREAGDRLPPGQYLTPDFPVLSAGPTPAVPRETWTFTVETEAGERRTWTWEQMMGLPQERPRVDIHCVTRWSKFDTVWQGVPVDAFLCGVDTSASYALAHCHGGYTTNLPLEDVTGGRAWIVHTFDDEPLPPEHGGPARLLVPHLYFWKSAKWIEGIRLLDHDRPGFWETAGYHQYGDPWREQRYQW
jgi:DMSO/TMAO reductase YedYZ molybdopterin-dependent catalytic subunit